LWFWILCWRSEWLGLYSKKLGSVGATPCLRKGKLVAKRIYVKTKKAINAAGDFTRRISLLHKN